jgi:hypothetical protein
LALPIAVGIILLSTGGFMRDLVPGLLPLLLLTGCAPGCDLSVPPQTGATWLAIQPYTAIEIASQEIIVAKKGYFSFQAAGLIP